MNLSTNAGFNAYAVLIPALGIIETMPDGKWKWTILGIVCVATAIVGFKTTGDKVVVDKSEPLEDVLKKGRE